MDTGGPKWHFITSVLLARKFPLRPVTSWCNTFY